MFGAGGGFHGNWPRKPNPKTIDVPQNAPQGPGTPPNRPQGPSPNRVQVPQNAPRGIGSPGIHPAPPPPPAPPKPIFSLPEPVQSEFSGFQMPTPEPKTEGPKEPEVGLIRTAARAVARWARGFARKGLSIAKPSRVAVVGWAGDSGVGRELVDACRNLEISAAFILENDLKPTRRELLGKLPYLTSKGTDQDMEGFLEAYRPETILTWETPGSWTFPALWRRRGIRWVNVVHWDWFNATRMDVWRLATLVAPNRMCQEELRKLGLSSVLLPVPIDTERIGFKLRSKAETFLSIYGYGGIYDRRSMPELLEAWRRVPGAPRLIILAQKEPPELDDILPVPGAEVCVGNLPEPADLYAIGDVAVQPSRYEGIGISLLEAQAAGMPVVTVNAPPMNEVARDLLVPVSEVIPIDTMGKKIPSHVPDAEALATIIQGLRGRDISALSRKGRRMVEREYSWEALRGRWTRLLREKSKDAGGAGVPVPEIFLPPKPGFPAKATGHEVLKMEPQVMWAGAFYGYSGYAKANREIVKRAMGQVRFQGAPDAPWEGSEKNPDNIRLYETLRAQTVHPSAPQITFLQPRIETRPGYRVIYTMMETEVVHPDMIETMNSQYHECWTPTRWNAEAFKKSGLRIPTCVMPLGMDPEVFHPEGPAHIPKALRLTGDTAGAYETPEGFLFIYVCEPTFRKGIEIVIEAFGKAFMPESDAGLVIASTAYSAQLFHPERIQGPKVWLLNKPLSESELASVYRGCQAYVCASRGEGWNLPVCEAAGCGLPVIVPRNSAHPEIVPPDQGYFFSPDHWHTFPNAKEVCRWFDGIEFPDYGEMAQRELALTMRAVKHHYPDARERGRRLMESMRSKYTWNHAAERVIERIRELCSR